MRVLQISNYYYPHIGGIEQVARNCSNALRRHEVKVFCFNHEKKNSIDNVDGVEIIRSGSFIKVDSQSLSFSYGKMLRKTVREFNPDCIIFHFPNPFAAHYLLKILKKNPEIKLIVYWHLDITKQKILGKLFNGQTKALLKSAERVIATSPNYLEGSKYLSRYKDKCVIIPNCVSAERAFCSGCAAECAEIRKEYEGKIICFALGRHIPYKGMEYLVRASKLLDDRFVVLIGGQGDLTQSLKDLAKDDGKVRFLGRLEEKYVNAYIQSCDIFCFPSITKNEAFGIALAEAMSFGKPSVTFTIHGSGVNYVSLNGVTGIEVENRNVEKYAQAIIALAENVDLREQYGKAAKLRVKELFTNERFDENIKKLIADL